MRLYSFRQWVASVVIVAMLFNVAAPLGICCCKDCYSQSNIWQFFRDPAVAEGKCCCTPSKPLSDDDDSSGSPEKPCPCGCCEIQQDDATVPKGAWLVEEPNVSPAWHIVPVLPLNFADASARLFRLDRRWVLPPPIPLHILLCVFLN